MDPHIPLRATPQKEAFPFLTFPEMYFDEFAACAALISPPPPTPTHPSKRTKHLSQLSTAPAVRSDGGLQRHREKLINC